jgi:hypothetical protein
MKVGIVVPYLVLWGAVVEHAELADALRRHGVDTRTIIGGSFTRAPPARRRHDTPRPTSSPSAGR